jgi:heme/copper-type cytochrome/quinol oxidase subunit 1
MSYFVEKFGYSIVNALIKKKKKSTAYRTGVKTVFVFHLLTVGSRLLVNDGSVAVDKQLVSCKWLIYPPLLQISQIISLKNCFDVSRTRY